MGLQYMDYEYTPRPASVAQVALINKHVVIYLQ